MHIHNISRFILLFAALFIAPLAASHAYEPFRPGALPESEQAKRDFVNHMAQDAISILYDQNRSFDARKTTLQNAFVSVVDIPWIARFVLGKSWNTASEEQRNRYMTLYRRFLTKSYISNFSEDPEKKIKDIKVLYIGVTENEKFGVRTQMLLASGQTVKVDYVVRDKDNRYKVIDIAVEGISLLASHRSIIGDIAATRGIGAAIRELEDRVKSPHSYALLDSTPTF